MTNAYEQPPVLISISSGAGTNLKVGEGGTCPARSTGKFCVLPLQVLQVQLVVLVSAFVMGSTVWSVSCLLFFYSRCPPVPNHRGLYNSGGTYPRALWSRRHVTDLDSR